MKTTTHSPSVLTRSLHVLLPLLLFLITCFGHHSTGRPALLVLVGCVVVLGIIRFRTFRDRISLPLIALMLYVAMCGISTFYSVSGKFALEEFLGIAVAFCAVILLLMLFPGNGASAARKIASVLAWSAALAGLFSIDQISTKLLSGTLHLFFSLFSSTFMDLRSVEEGVRIITIFGNANIFAGCVGIGVMLSLGLAISAQSKWERRGHLCCLYINSMAFLLAFSMGGSASIAVAFLIYLLLEHKDRRSELFLLMVNTLAVTGAGVAVCSMTSLDTWDGIQPIPLVCLAVGSVLLCLIHEQLGTRLARVLARKGKLLIAAASATLVLFVGYLVVANSVTSPIYLAKSSELNRSVYPAPGSYTVSSVGGDHVRVFIRSQNKHEAMMHTYNYLYIGPLREATFTVPEDSLVVHFLMYPQQDTTLEQITYTGPAGQGSVPLSYPLLPHFIANRLQGLFANHNAIQRTVFFEDGIKLFKMRPLFGFGLGAFMTVAQSVQDFHYETRYVHNHYIQTMMDMGVVGLFLFVSLLALSAACVLKARKRGSFHPLTPALGAALMFMCVHALVEMTFSVYCFLPLAFGVFALIGLCCGDTLPVPGKRIRTAFCVIPAILLLVFSFFLTRNMTARSITEQSKSFDAYDRAATMDPFEWKDYAVNYMLNSIRSDTNGLYRQRGAHFAQRLDCGPSNIVYLRLAEYYLATGQVEQAMHMAKIHAGYIASSSEEWNNLMHMLAKYAQTDPVFLDGVAQLADMINTWNAEHLGSIELDERAQLFVDLALAQ